MALINCPECGQQVSNAAEACPHCGFPVARSLAQAAAPVPPATTEVLAEVRPSWWGYFWHLVFFWLIVPWIVAWWQRGGTVLRIYPGRIVLERGRFSKCYREFMVRDIRAIDIDQSFVDRMVGIGDITISTAATTDASEQMRGIPDPQAIRDLILSERQGPKA